MRVVKIHLFIDGNGRTARLLMNFELMKNGYTQAVIEKEMQPEYYDALDLAHTTGEYGIHKFSWAVCRKQFRLVFERYGRTKILL